VLLIAQADERAWSFASIESKTGGSKLRREGDEIDSHQLRFIAWDRVWFSQSGKRCQMKMGDKTNATPAPRRGKSVSQKRKKKRRRRGAKLPPEIANKISRVSDTEFNIERSAVEQILDQQSSLFRRVKMRPVRDGDKVTGLRISRVRSGTLFDALGVKNGDEIQSINGFELSNPQRALEAYGRLRTAKKLRLTVKRNGQLVTLEFNIQ
jgi:general secretion pathway protein C